MNRSEQKICQKNLIAAYVDGELSDVANAIFEQHVEDCPECRAELRAHRVFVCELDAALAGKVEIPVPDDFSKVIAVRARSDMRGVRSRSEPQSVCDLFGARADRVWLTRRHRT
jgi:anti-sigma factor RsiW